MSDPVGLGPPPVDRAPHPVIRAVTSVLLGLAAGAVASALIPRQGPTIAPRGAVVEVASRARAATSTVSIPHPR